MQTKLTLSVDKATVEKAKKYVAMNQTSISQLVEKHLQQLTVEFDPDLNKSKHPITDSLLGSVPQSSHKSDRDLIVEYLEEKYL